MVELTRPIERRVGGVRGGFVIRLEKDGSVTLRGFRKQASATLPLDALAFEALKRQNVSLTEEEWRQPVKQIQRLAYHRREHPAGGGNE